MPTTIPTNRLAGALPSANGKHHDYSKVFAQFGVTFGQPTGSGEVCAEECPFCGKDKFHVNVGTGKYHCKHCQEGGNVTTFLTWQHGRLLEATTKDHYLTLKAKRGIASQTLRSHELAYDEAEDRWLIPFKSSKDSVVNIQLYYPNKPKPNKYNLPELPTALYGFHTLTGDKDKTVYLCEGPFDAIALDYNIGHKNRHKYIILATPGSFKEEWAPHFAGLRVKVCHDNDKGGREQSAREQKLLSPVAHSLTVLKWPEGLDGYDLNDLVKNRPGLKLPGWIEEHSYKVTREPRLDWDDGWNRKDTEPEVYDWIWPNRLFCGTYVSYSGYRGTMKSTIIRELVARYTRGEPMPGCTEVGLPAGHAIYITAEDSKASAWRSLELVNADMNLVTVLPALLKDGDPLNVLEHLGEVREKIHAHGTRLVIIDGQNSVVGDPNISNDMKARSNVTNRLHQFAQKENICLVGIRNEDRDGRPYGPASFGDLGRCIMRSIADGDPIGDDYYFHLVFERVSEVSPKLYRPIPYSVEDLGGSARRILWGKVKPKPTLGQQLETFHAKAGGTSSQGGKRSKNRL